MGRLSGAAAPEIVDVLVTAGTTANDHDDLYGFSMRKLGQELVVDPMAWHQRCRGSDPGAHAYRPALRAQLRSCVTGG
ncbi:MAG: hypothetical protein IT198_08240 [Acidimicrobiia bacterium]|nr:hypothetical protein [Acidimicrobiia bacterium]